MGSTVCQKPFKIQMFPASMTIFITYIRTRKKKICKSAPLALTDNKQTHTHTHAQLSKIRPRNCGCISLPPTKCRYGVISVWLHYCVLFAYKIHADRIPDQHWNVHIDTGQHLSNIGGLSMSTCQTNTTLTTTLHTGARTHTHTELKPVKNANTNGGLYNLK